MTHSELHYENTRRIVFVGRGGATFASMLLVKHTVGGNMAAMQVRNACLGAVDELSCASF